MFNLGGAEGLYKICKDYAGYDVRGSEPRHLMDLFEELKMDMDMEALSVCSVTSFAPGRPVELRL